MVEPGNNVPIKEFNLADRRPKHAVLQTGCVANVVATGIGVILSFFFLFLFSFSALLFSEKG
jgi:hypothetical protein